MPRWLMETRLLLFPRPREGWIGRKDWNCVQQKYSGIWRNVKDKLLVVCCQLFVVRRQWSVAVGQGGCGNQNSLDILAAIL